VIYAYRQTSIKCWIPNKRRGAKAYVLINAGSQLNIGVFWQYVWLVLWQLSEYQPYTSYVTAIPTRSADTDNSLFFKLNAEN